MGRVVSMARVAVFVVADRRMDDRLHASPRRSEGLRVHVRVATLVGRVAEREHGGRPQMHREIADGQLLAVLRRAGSVVEARARRVAGDVARRHDRRWTRRRDDDRRGTEAKRARSRLRCDEQPDHVAEVAALRMRYVAAVPAWHATVSGPRTDQPVVSRVRPGAGPTRARRQRAGHPRRTGDPLAGLARDGDRVASDTGFGLGFGFGFAGGTTFPGASSR